MKVLCIDFETANGFIGSICAVGAAFIENGKMTGSKSWLVRPHPRYFRFDTFNTMIHGITAGDVENAPEFDAVYSQLRPFFTDCVVAAHNASFDMSALRHVLALYEIPCPELNYICTCKTARKTWAGLRNYKLNTVCQYINVDFRHHQAHEDAIACGNILLAAMAEKGASDVYQLTQKIGLRLGRLYPGGYTACGAFYKKALLFKASR